MDLTLVPSADADTATTHEMQRPIDIDGFDTQSLGDDTGTNNNECDNDDDDVALECESAATAIQHAWHAHRSSNSRYQQQALAATDTNQPSALTASTPMCDAGVCCSCFGPIKHTSLRSSSTCATEHGDDHMNDAIFCAACLYVMTTAGSKAFTSTSSSSHSAAAPHSNSININTVGSPLPKLSKLVQAEARYQDQLELLRTQRAVLQQQQQAMQSRKDAQAQQVAAEKVAARERRRRFQATIARRQREEALKLGQLASSRSSKSGTPEQEDDGEENEDSEAPVTKASVKRTTRRMKEIIPVPFVRTPARLSSVSSDCVGSNSNSSSSNTNTALLPRLDATTEQQRRRTMRQMLGCYAQDLTPLVNGERPKQLRVPSPLVSSTHNSKSNAVVVRKSVSLSHNSSSSSSSKTLNKTNTTAQRPSSHVRLHPIDKRPNNQRDDSAARTNATKPQAATATASSSTSFYARSTPAAALTAEIKPISWIQSLGYGVLDDDSDSHMHNSNSNSHNSLAMQSHVQQQQQLSVVLEEPTHDSMQWGERFDLRLQHAVPAKTVLGGSEHLSASSTGSSSAVPPAPQPVAAAAAQWEYSTDRLTSLLEKYKVSVTAAATTSSNSKQ